MGGRTPDTYGNSGEPGLVAVRTKFGDAMEAEFRAWPHTARTYFTALYGDRHGTLDGWGQERVNAEVRAAEGRLARACRDKDFALDCAGGYARSTLLFPLGTVPAVRQYRELFGMVERDHEAADRAAAAVAHRDRVSTAALVDHALAEPPEILFDPDDVNRRKAEARAAAAREEESDG